MQNKNYFEFSGNLFLQTTSSIIAAGFPLMLIDTPGQCVDFDNS